MMNLWKNVRTICSTAWEAYKPGRPRTLYLKYVQDLLGDSDGMLQPNNISSLAQDRSGWRNLVVACSAAEWWWWYSTIIKPAYYNLSLLLSLSPSPSPLFSLTFVVITDLTSYFACFLLNTTMLSLQNPFSKFDLVTKYEHAYCYIPLLHAVSAAILTWFCRPPLSDVLLRPQAFSHSPMNTPMARDKDTNSLELSFSRKPSWYSRKQHKIWLKWNNIKGLKLVFYFLFHYTLIRGWTLRILVNHFTRVIQKIHPILIFLPFLLLWVTWDIDHGHSHTQTPAFLSNHCAVYGAHLVLLVHQRHMEF